MQPSTTPATPEGHLAERVYLQVWAALVALTLLLVLASRLGPGPALAGLLVLTPLKAGLVFYFFMHLREEGALVRTVVLVTLGTLVIFFALLFSDAPFR